MEGSAEEDPFDTLFPSLVEAIIMMNNRVAIQRVLPHLDHEKIYQLTTIVSEMLMHYLYEIKQLKRKRKLIE